MVTLLKLVAGAALARLSEAQVFRPQPLTRHGLSPLTAPGARASAATPARNSRSSAFAPA